MISEAKSVAVQGVRESQIMKKNNGLFLPPINKKKNALGPIITEDIDMDNFGQQQFDIDVVSRSQSGGNVVSPKNDDNGIMAIGAGIDGIFSPKALSVEKNKKPF